MSCAKKTCSSNCRCNTVPLRFNGDDIACLGVNKGDSFEAVIRKVSDFVCNISFADGEDGQSVDHVSFTSSTGGSAGLAGHTDTYTVWGDALETINLGTFIVYNGSNAPIEGDTVFHKVLDVGEWDMDTDVAPAAVAHGLDFSKIISVAVHIYNDAEDSMFPLDVGSAGPGTSPAGGWFVNATSILLYRTNGEYFDSLDFASSLINRGKILIHYIP
jgi:hypothetical protein